MDEIISIKEREREDITEIYEWYGWDFFFQKWKTNKKDFLINAKKDCFEHAERKVRRSFLQTNKKKTYIHNADDND